MVLLKGNNAVYLEGDQVVEFERYTSGESMNTNDYVEVSTIFTGISSISRTYRNRKTDPIGKVS